MLNSADRYRQMAARVVTCRAFLIGGIRRIGRVSWVVGRESWTEWCEMLIAAQKWTIHMPSLVKDLQSSAFFTFPLHLASDYQRLMTRDPRPTSNFGPILAFPSL